jgi:ferredoxin
MFEVEQIYRAAGLEAASAELPDHASVELAFLAYLAEQQSVSTSMTKDWQLIEARFIEAHAGRWLPGLGRSLAASGDAVYAPLGLLLADWLGEAGGRVPNADAAVRSKHIPALQPVESCTLCGFCAQVCVTHALAIQESPYETVLVRHAAACNACGRCTRVCPAHILQLAVPPAEEVAHKGTSVLRVSPRMACPSCGIPTVSRAELESVVTQIGHPAWLELCPDCRTSLTEAML